MSILMITGTKQDKRVRPEWPDPKIGRNFTKVPSLIGASSRDFI